MDELFAELGVQRGLGSGSMFGAFKPQLQVRLQRHRGPLALTDIGTVLQTPAPDLAFMMKHGTNVSALQLPKQDFDILRR